MESDVVGMFEGIGDVSGDVLVEEGCLQFEGYFVLEDVYFDLFCEEDQLDCVDAHPRHVLVKRS